MFSRISLPVPSNWMRLVRFLSVARIALLACGPVVGTSSSSSQTRLRKVRFRGGGSAGLPSGPAALTSSNRAAAALTSLTGRSRPRCTHRSSRASQTWSEVGYFSVQLLTWRSTRRQFPPGKTVGLISSATRS